MNVLDILKKRIKFFLVWLDSKLGGDSSTQTHAGNWEKSDSA